MFFLQRFMYENVGHLSWNFVSWGFLAYCTMWLFVLEKCDAQPAEWCVSTVLVMQSIFQSCSALSVYGSVWLYSTFICGVIKFVIVSLCLINEHWWNEVCETTANVFLKNTFLAYIFLPSLVHRWTRKRRFAIICLTFKTSIDRFPKNLGT